MRSSSSLWAQEGGEDDMFIDRAVYTRNRSFRLYLSSKAGKEAVLLPAGEAPSAPSPAHNRRHVPRGALECILEVVLLRMKRGVTAGA